MKKIIKLTESQLKKMVEQTINQEENQFYKLIDNQWGDIVKPIGRGKQIILSNGDKVGFSSSGECYYISKADGTVTAGKIVPSGTTDFKLVFEDGDSYDSVTEKRPMKIRRSGLKSLKIIKKNLEVLKKLNG